METTTNLKHSEIKVWFDQAKSILQKLKQKHISKTCDITLRGGECNKHEFGVPMIFFFLKVPT